MYSNHVYSKHGEHDLNARHQLWDINYTIIITPVLSVCLFVCPRNLPTYRSTALFKIGVDTVVGTGWLNLAWFCTSFPISIDYSYRSTCDLVMCSHRLLTMPPTGNQLPIGRVRLVLLYSTLVYVVLVYCNSYIHHGYWLVLTAFLRALNISATSLHVFPWSVLFSTSCMGNWGICVKSITDIQALLNWMHHLTLLKVLDSQSVLVLQSPSSTVFPSALSASFPAATGIHHCKKQRHHQARECAGANTPHYTWHCTYHFVHCKIYLMIPETQS